MNTKEIETNERSINQSGGSKSAVNDLCNSQSGETVIEQVEQFEQHEVKGTPFKLYGKKGHYNLLLGNEVVSPKTYKNVEEAQKRLKDIPWDEIFLANYVYGEYMKKSIERIKNQSLTEHKNKLQK